MKADFLTYRRAAGVCLLGLAVQVLFTGVYLVYGLLAKDSTALTATIFHAIGLVAWGSLAIVFDQHRRERIEAMEAEALAASPVSGSVFEKGADEFRPAARRLNALHKVFLPTVSLLIAALLIGFGVWRFMALREFVNPDRYRAVAPTKDLWVLLPSILSAVVGFLVARYSASLAKHSAWSNLRGGAGYAVGSALLGAAMAAAYLSDRLAPPPALGRYMLVAVPVFMVALGAETILNFVLSIYRPRKAGDRPRPAFDSGLLSFASAPDRIAQSINDAINYQLGFNITSGWFYKLVTSRAPMLLSVGAALVWVLSCFAVVEPHQKAIVLRLGSPVRVVDSGLVVKMPWPIEQLYIPEYFVRDAKGREEIKSLTVTGVRELVLGTSPPANKDAILWTNDHIGEEVYQYVRPEGGGKDDGADIGDIAMVSVEVPLQYAIRDVKLYDEFAPPGTRDSLLKAAAQREVFKLFQGLTLERVLGQGRREISEELRTRVQAAFDGLNPGPDGKARGAGVEVVFTGVVGVHPPKETAKAFERTVQTDQYREAMIEAARGDEVKTLVEVAGDFVLARNIVQELDVLQQLSDAKATQAQIAEQEGKIRALIEAAGGAAASKLAEASASRWEKHMGDRGRASRYAGQLALYRAAPKIYRATLYFDAMKESMAGSRLYVVSDKVRDSRYDVNLEDKQTGLDVFDPGKQE
jgi:regulator of protease activity HflC (stomatin/prohibitin superfamily)